MSNENAVERINGDIKSCKAGQRFAFSEPGVHQESGALRLEEGDIPRAARGQDGDAQADRFCPLFVPANAPSQLVPQICREQTPNRIDFWIMAERCRGVNGERTVDQGSLRNAVEYAAKGLPRIERRGNSSRGMPSALRSAKLPQSGRGGETTASAIREFLKFYDFFTIPALRGALDSATVTPSLGPCGESVSPLSSEQPMLRDVIEKVLFFHDGHKTFLAPEAYPWVAKVEAEAPLIRRELDVLLQRRDEIPNFQDISEYQKALTQGEQWKTFFLYGYGQAAEENCKQCPETVRILKYIPGMKTAMFSILAPGKHIPPHRGMYKGVLRYHLGLLIPGPPGVCRIRVGQDVRAWQEGKSLVFDDSHEHEVWNDADGYRVVLFVDLLRPVFFPFSLANRVIVWALSHTKSITEPMERIRNKTYATGTAKPAEVQPEPAPRAVGRGAGA